MLVDDPWGVTGGWPGPARTGLLPPMLPACCHRGQSEGGWALLRTETREEPRATTQQSPPQVSQRPGPEQPRRQAHEHCHSPVGDGRQLTTVGARTGGGGRGHMHTVEYSQ